MKEERLQGVRNVYARFDGYVPRPNGVPDRATGPKIVHFERVIWTTMPDQGVALAALQKGEQDWWEFASQDLVPVMRKDPALRAEVLETEGNFMMVRFNQLYPPFNRPEMRRVILRAVDQEDFVAAVGGDAEFQRPGIGFFPLGIRRDGGWPGNHPAALTPAQAEGTGGSRLQRREDHADLAGGLSQCEDGERSAGRCAEEIGINLEYISIDWSTMTQRVIKKEPPENGSFHIHMLNVPCLSVASPLVNSRTRGTGAEESGRYKSPRYEELRAQWLLTETA